MTEATQQQQQQSNHGGFPGGASGNPVFETAKETQMYRTVFWTLWEREGGIIWENGIEICIISYKKQIASPGSMQDTGSLGLLHWDLSDMFH